MSLYDELRGPLRFNINKNNCSSNKILFFNKQFIRRSVCIKSTVFMPIYLL